MFNIPQLLNALTMVSPLYVWMRKRKSHVNNLFHKCLIIHIPVSFLYHLFQGLCIQGRTTQTLKVVDCIFVHLYTIICNVGITTYKKIKFTRFETYTRRVTHTLNMSCVLRMVKNPILLDDVLFSFERILALGILSVSTLRHTEQCKNGCLNGLSCASLFIGDRYLAGYGHCLFHVLLGCLHNTVYKCFEVQPLIL